MDSKQKHIDGLASLALAKRLSRRGFMEGVMAMGATAAAATVLWNTKVEAATAKPGGTFRVALDDGNTSDSLDPATYNSRFMITLVHTRTNFLTEIGGDNKVMGELAESFEATPDAKTWTFKIRKGVEFHDGKTFDADDAVATLNYHRGTDSKSAAKSLLSGVDEIKSDGKNTLVMKLKEGNADLPYALTDYHLVMLASKDGKIDPQSRNGTGGYVLDDFQPGVSAKLSKFKNYWKEDRAHFDAVNFIAVNDVTARTNALMGGEVDAMIECDFKTADSLKQAQDVTLDEVPSGTFVDMAMHMDEKPFDNADVRMALKYAIDRKAAVETVLSGHGSIGNDHPISPIMPYYDASLEQRAYDSDKAKFYLKKAGLSDIKVQLSAADTVIAGAVDMALLFADNAAKAGITIDVVREPNDGYWSNVWLKKPFFMAGWGQRPTPDIIFSLAFAKGADWNETHFADPRFNNLLVAARAELDQKKRQAQYSEMQKIVSDTSGAIIPFFRNWLYARNKKVAHGDMLSANWPLDGARGAERWWFAS